MTGSRWIGVVLAGCLAAGGAGAADYDLIISGGRVVDGTGAPWFRADVGIRGDRIAAIANLEKASATRRVDATGRYVTPGFIDMLGQSELNLLVDNRVESKIRQGITTEVTGEGVSVAPMNDVWIAEAKPWLDKYHLIVGLEGSRWVLVAPAQGADRRSTCATYVGASRYAGSCWAWRSRTPDADQLKRMEREVEIAMRAGRGGRVLRAHLSAWLVRADRPS